MISSFKTKDGFIYAYAEYDIVKDYAMDKKIRCDPEGKYVCVKEVWIHERLRRIGLLQEIILEIFKNSGQAMFVYWITEKCNRRSRVRPITDLLRFTRLREVIENGKEQNKNSNTIKSTKTTESRTARFS